ncbi:MAG: signal peptidase I [Deltaproteobacteria bacterium]|nr:signal peptidase I [Deltaproteobacteria bacterium]MBI3077388.1 signal peptidase I [Deltaproteobacteria bacterium]
MGTELQQAAREEAREKPEAEKAQARRKSWVREYGEAIVIALLLALVIRTFVVQAFKIPSGSMKPTLQVGDHILVNKFTYGTKVPFTDLRVLPLEHPTRGDVIVFVYPVDPDKDFIKRVIGVEGDRVEVVNKKIFVNGQTVPDPWAVFEDDSPPLPRSASPRDNFGPVVVPPGSLFVMGDNRDHSYDSRFWGFVKLSAVKGRAFIIYWSWDSNDHVVRWRRLAHLIH